MRRLRFALPVPLAVAAALGCGPQLVEETGGVSAGESSENTSTSGTSTSPATSPDGTSPSAGSTNGTTTSPTEAEASSGSGVTATPTTSVADTSSSGEAEDTGFETAAFIQNPDGGWHSYECDEWDQDCPPGEKCTMWANDGGASVNATKCVPVVDDPVADGAPCSYEGSLYSGLDECDIGSFCFPADIRTGEGTCTAFCDGSWSDPYCASPDHVCSVSSSLAICLPSCDPLLQDCAAGEGCYELYLDGFACAPDASGEGGEFGDPCEFLNACSVGLSCEAAETVPGCKSGSCCTPFCDITQATPCPDGFECGAVFPPGQAPPGQENIGLCRGSEE